jgi:hypothetical protein
LILSTKAKPNQTKPNQTKKIPPKPHNWVAHSPSVSLGSFGLPSLPWDTRRRGVLRVLYLWIQHGGGVSSERWSGSLRATRLARKVSMWKDGLFQEVVAGGPLHALQRVP